MAQEVTTEEIDHKTLVELYEDLQADEVEYEFSNGREFLRPTAGERGVYTDA